MIAYLLALVLMGVDIPPVPAPTPTPMTIQVVDLDDAIPHHVIVIVDGEPFKATTLPIGAFPVPPGPTPGPAPGPAPPPIPPDPTPAPVAGVLWTTYIMPAAPTEADARPPGDLVLNALRKPGSVEWRYQAVGDGEISRRKFDDFAKDAPIAVFQDKTGKVLSTLKGNDPAAIAAKIKAYKGVK